MDLSNDNITGLLKEKFPCLNHLRVDVNFAAKTVLACCVLHNIALTVARENTILNEGGTPENSDDDNNVDVFSNLSEDNSTMETILRFFS